MGFLNKKILLFLWCCLLAVFLWACGDDDNGESYTLNPQLLLTPPPAYQLRQAAYLDFCYAHNGPGQGGIHGQVCRASRAAGGYDEEKIIQSLSKIDNREDTSDFDLNSILRILFLDRKQPSLPQELRERMNNTVLNFKYWLDEPGPDTLCWWSENHQILFHTAELLAGLLFPDDIFPNSGMTGAEHVDHAVPLIHQWLDFRGLFGFSEWHSNVYFNEDIPPLVNLVDFAHEETIRTKAAMVLDILAFDMACNYYQGRFATVHGRTYPNKLLDGLSDSTTEAAYIMLGLGGYESTGNFSGAFLATSHNYITPPILEAIARHASSFIEHRQHDSINIDEGPRYGIGYEDFQDVMFWWGAEGYAFPEIISASFQMVEAYNIWEGFFWSDVKFLRFLVGSPFLPLIVELYDPIASGVVLEGMDTYTYRTPYYQLSGAMDYKPYTWTGQVHTWQATLDREAYVFTTYPGGFEDDYMGGPWTGGFIPRAVFHKNVGIIQYYRPRLFLLDELFFPNYSHAYFPRNAFDDVIGLNNWTIGRKGDAYVALYSQHPVHWSTENDYELIAAAKENVWIVELGAEKENGPFTTFVDAVQNAIVEIDEEVYYHSPSQGIMIVGKEGPFTVAGVSVDLGPFDRWDNPYCHQPFGDSLTLIEFENKQLRLDFQIPRRAYKAY